MNNIEKKVIVITGASSGLGEATARLLAKKGAKVVIGARRTEKLEAIERQILKEKLLKSLENVDSIPSGGVSTEDALYEIRQRELNQLVSNDE